MKLRCKINNKEYDICQGVPFSDEYNETLDSGTIIIDQVHKMKDLRPYDDVVVWDADYEYLGYNEDGEPLFKGYTFDSWDSILGNPRYKEGKTIFCKHLLVDGFSKEIVNLCGRADNKTIYKYKIQMFSETKGLEVVQLPNLSITEPLNMNKKISVWEYMNKYIDLYSPKYKRRKKLEDGTYSNDEWEFVLKYKLSPSLKEKFDNVYSPDFELNGSNLRDLLAKLMIVKDMIPYVKNGVIYAMNITERVGNFENNPEHVNFITGNYTSSNYCDSLRTTYSNAISDESSCRYTEYLGFRNYDNPLMTLDNMRIETKFPIYKINKMYMCYYKKYILRNDETGEEISKVFLCKQDITPFVKMDTERNLLSQDWEDFNTLSLIGSSIDDFANFKMATVGYSIGSTSITGWGQTFNYPKEGVLSIWDIKSTYIENIFKIVDRKNPYGQFNYTALLDGNDPNKYTVRFNNLLLMGNIVSPFTNSSLKLKSFFFQIDYQGFYNGAVVHSKDIGRDDIVINNNPNSGLTILEKDGLYQKEQLNRFGNETVTIKARYDDISQLQPLGSVLNLEDEDDIIIYHREYSVYDTMILVTYTGSKDYVLKNYHTSVYAKHRTWSLMSYGEAVTRAENRKMFLELSKDSQFYENEDTLNFNGIIKENPKTLIGAFTPSNNSDVNKLNVGIIKHNGYSYLTDCNSFVCGNSLCFNLGMRDNISSGMNITVPEPDMNQNYGEFVESLNTLSGFNVKQILEYAKMDGVEGDYSGSLQDWYPLIDDRETGFSKNIGFYLGSTDKTELQTEEIFDENKEYSDKIYDNLFALPKLLNKWERIEKHGENEYRGEVRVKNWVIENSKLLNDKEIFDNNTITLVYDSFVNIKLYKNEEEINVQSVIRDFDAEPIREFAIDVINKIKIKVAEIKDEKGNEDEIYGYKTLNNDSVFKATLVSNGLSESIPVTNKWKFEDNKFEISGTSYTVSDEVEIFGDTFGIELLPEFYPDFKNQYKMEIEMNILNTEKEGWKSGDKMVDIKDLGIWLSDFPLDGETFTIQRKESLSLLNNVVGNDYELYKDNKEKIDMTYQIEPITNDKDILITPWFMKLNDLITDYEKNEEDFLVENLIKYNYKSSPISFWASCHYTKDSNNGYPFMFIMIDTDLLSNIKKIYEEEETKGVEKKHIDFVTNVVYTKAKWSQYNFIRDTFFDYKITKFKFDTNFISEMLFDDDGNVDSITLNCTEKINCNYKIKEDLTTIQNRTFKKTQTIKFDGKSYNVYLCKFGDLKKKELTVDERDFTDTFHFRCWLKDQQSGKIYGSQGTMNKIPSEESGCLPLPLDIIYNGESVLSNSYTSSEKKFKNMFVGVSNNHLSHQLVYNKYQFINEWDKNVEYKVGDLIYKKGEFMDVDTKKYYDKMVYRCVDDKVRNMLWENEKNFDVAYIIITNMSKCIDYIDKYKLEKYINSELIPYNDSLLDEGKRTLNLSYNANANNETDGLYFYTENPISPLKKINLESAGITANFESVNDGDLVYIEYEVSKSHEGFEIVAYPKGNPYYIKDEHLYRNDWSFEDWQKEDIKLINKNVKDVFNVQRDNNGRVYIYVDLTDIEGSSVQYWYVNNNSIELVFGVNFSEEDKQRGYIKIYISLLSSRDKRVYDENHNFIGEIWNYINENDDKEYGKRQYFKQTI